MQGDIVSGVLLPLILAFIMFSLGLGLTVSLGMVARPGRRS